MSIDPAGVVRSQVVESDDGGLRLTLNGAENRRTLAGHFIAESFGSGVQHLAFASRDIFQTADRLTELGFNALEISPNYYDDLEARLGLEPEFTDRLRSRKHPLRSRRGRRLFPALQPDLRRRLLLRDRRAARGYKGYGAPNAPFRIAAQKRVIRPTGMPR